MKLILAPFIFMVILFLYLHVYYNYKTSDDLEMYEINYMETSKFNDFAELRQPVYIHESSKEAISLGSEINGNRNQNLNMRLMTDDDTVLLPKDDAQKLLVGKEKYISRGNYHLCQDYEERLKDILYEYCPSHAVNSKYDVLYGSKDAYTRPCYEIYYRNYVTVVSGKATVRLVPPKYASSLKIEPQYDSFEFVTTTQLFEESSSIQFFDVSLNEGSSLYIPPYWVYSIMYSDSDTCLLFHQYQTVMNFISNIHHHGLYYLQQYNIREKPAQKTIKTKE